MSDETNENEIDSDVSANDSSELEESLPQLPATNEKLMVLATFDNSIEANLLRNELGQFGIPSRVANDNTASLLGATLAGPSSAFWIELMILESDAERALEIKEKWLAGQEEEQPVEIPEWKCGCGETVDAGFALCWSCGENYAE